MTESLTTNLRLELERTNNVFNRFVENQKDKIDSSDATFDRKLEESNCTINALKENDSQLEESRIINDNIKRQQKQEIEQVITNNEILSQQQRICEQELRKAEESEERETARLDLIRTEHESLRSKMEQSLNDLTHGVRHYKALGLEFQKSEGDCMKFVFTQIDPHNVSRVFYFLMFVDANNQYQLVETNPALNKQSCVAFLGKLNDNNDIGMFVYYMRQLFCAGV
jgi:chromosome segregation ATPase